MKKKSFKIVCFIISLMVMLSSLSGTAIAKTTSESLDYNIDTTYDEVDQHYFDYYKEYYGVNLIKIEIDSEIYYINEDIEITDEFINSIKTNKANGTFDVSIPEDIEHDHSIECTDHIYETYDIANDDVDDGNLIEIEVDGEIYYINEIYIDLVDLIDFENISKSIKENSVEEQNVHDKENDHPIKSSVACPPHNMYIMCGGEGFCMNWCGYTTPYLPHLPAQIRIKIVGSAGICYTYAGYCPGCDTQISSTFTVTSHNMVNSGYCGSRVCNVCNYRIAGSNHRLNQRTVILGLPSACWQSEMYCTNGGGCSYYYIAHIERSHDLSKWDGKRYICTRCGSSGL